tara:strand:+ start:3907 stop:4134 length:228 start_codon:yes stop_codon:yes gene_type:complete
MSKRDLRNPLSASKFDKNDPPPYVTGKSRTIALKKLNNKLRAAGHTHGANDPRAPKYTLSQDTKTGAYNYRRKNG